MNIVIDTNIFISSLIKKGITRYIITNFNYNFLFPEFELIEIQNHKNEIIKKSKLSGKQFNILLLRLLKYVRIIPKDIITPIRQTAENIMGHIDKDDVLFIATALTFNCPIWSDDKHFLMQNEINILTTKDIIHLIK